MFACLCANLSEYLTFDKKRKFFARMALYHMSCIMPYLRNPYVLDPCCEGKVCREFIDPGCPVSIGSKRFIFHTFALNTKSYVCVYNINFTSSYAKELRASLAQFPTGTFEE